MSDIQDPMMQKLAQPFKTNLRWNNDIGAFVTPMKILHHKQISKNMLQKILWT